MLYLKDFGVILVGKDADDIKTRSLGRPLGFDIDIGSRYHMMALILVHKFFGSLAKDGGTGLYFHKGDGRFILRNDIHLQVSHFPVTFEDAESFILQQIDCGILSENANLILNMKMPESHGLEGPFKAVLGVLNRKAEIGKGIADTIACSPILVTLGIEADIEQQIHSRLIGLVASAFGGIVHSET